MPGGENEDLGFANVEVAPGFLCSHVATFSKALGI